VKGARVLIEAGFDFPGNGWSENLQKKEVKAVTEAIKKK